MLYYDAARALLDQIELCFDGCDYTFFVSLGVPPAVCSSIAVHFGGSFTNNDSDECLLVTDDTLSVTITRCCVEPEKFDPVVEEKNAKCFLEDLFLLKQCIACEAAGALSALTVDCSPTVESIRVDSEPEGGCYSATISLAFTEVTCC